MRTILAAIDFSSATHAIVEEATKLARALQAKLLLVTVLVEPIFVKEYAPPPRGVARLMVANERAVRARLATLRQQVQTSLVPAETIVRRGNAAAHILEEADEHDAAYIVIGSHGHSAFYDLVLGSTTQRVLRQARQIVMVIPPGRARIRRRTRSRPPAVAEPLPPTNDVPSPAGASNLVA